MRHAERVLMRTADCGDGDVQASRVSDHMIRQDGPRPTFELAEVRLAVVGPRSHHSQADTGSVARRPKPLPKTVQCAPPFCKLLLTADWFRSRRVMDRLPGETNLGRRTQ